MVSTRSEDSTLDERFGWADRMTDSARDRRRPIRAVFFDVGEVLIDESTEYGSWADWLGVPRHVLGRVWPGHRPGSGLPRSLSAFPSGVRPHDRAGATCPSRPRRAFQRP